MQVLESDLCPECSVRVVDAGDELVCPKCGIAREKEVIDQPPGPRPRPRDALKASLGGFMGSRDPAGWERSSRGISGNDSKYRYLKTISDFAGREEGQDVACAKLIERVGERLCIPAGALLEAASISARVLAAVPSRRRYPLAAVSAHSLIAACRLTGVTGVSSREIMDAHLALGRRLSTSAVFQVAIESPVRSYAHGPSRFLSRVLGRLSASPRLADRLAREGANPGAYFQGLRETAAELLRLTGSEVEGKRPCAVAASALYSAEAVLARCESRGRRMTQRDAAEFGATSEYTVRDQCAAIFSPAVEKLAARRLRNQTSEAGR